MSRRSRNTHERFAAATEEKPKKTKTEKTKVFVAALSTELQSDGWKLLPQTEVPKVYTPPLQQLPLPFEPQPPFFELFIQKWRALSIVWKGLAGVEITLGVAAIIVGVVFCPKVVMTAVLVSAIALILVTVVGHLAHIAMTPARKAKKPTISDLVPSKRKRKPSASNDSPAPLTSSFAF